MCIVCRQQRYSGIDKIVGEILFGLAFLQDCRAADKLRVDLVVWEIVGIFAFKIRNMNRIVIPVNDSTAFTWQNASVEQRTQLINLFCWLVEKEQWEKFTPQTFSILLDKISDKAIANGLTPEILNEILNES